MKHFSRECSNAKGKTKCEYRLNQTFDWESKQNQSIISVYDNNDTVKNYTEINGKFILFEFFFSYFKRLI